MLRTLTAPADCCTHGFMWLSVLWKQESAKKKNKDNRGGWSRTKRRVRGEERVGSHPTWMLLYKDITYDAYLCLPHIPSRPASQQLKYPDPLPSPSLSHLSPAGSFLCVCHSRHPIKEKIMKLFLAWQIINVTEWKWACFPLVHSFTKAPGPQHSGTITAAGNQRDWKESRICSIHFWTPVQVAFKITFLP